MSIASGTYNIIKAAANADFDNEYYYALYSISDTTVTVNGLSLPLVAGVIFNTDITSISATADVYIIGDYKTSVDAPITLSNYPEPLPPEPVPDIVTPSIVTDGLIYHIDAGNTDSYPGSGTIVSSLTGSTDDGALVNGVGFTSDDGGAFTFDGVDDYINVPDNDVFSFGNSSTDSPFSLEVWVNMTSALNFRIFNKFASSQREWTIYTTGTGLLTFVLYSYHSNYIYQFINKNDGDMTSYENQWVNISATYDGRGAPNPYDGMNLYINGSLQSVNKVFNGTYIALGNKSEPVKIGRQDSVYANGKVSVAKIYNKELSASEVLQNYNALSGRYV